MRRVVTGFNSEGKSIIAEDREAEVMDQEGVPYVPFVYLWRIEGDIKIPQPLPKDLPRPDRPAPGIPLPGGTSFFTVIFRPNQREVNGRIVQGEPHSQMHETDTVDFVVVQSGEIYMGLDGGEEILLKAGDTLIQTGTNHIWDNRSDKDAVLTITMLSASK